MFIMGTPGMDFMENSYKDEKSKAEILEEHPIWGQVIIALYAVNREIRRPIFEVLQPLERPLGIRQDWGLFRDGPSRVRRLEIYVDGELKHRSADPDYPWLNPQLRNRRMRSLVEEAVRKLDPAAWSGLVRFVSERVQA